MSYPGLLHPETLPLPCGRLLLTCTFAGDIQTQLWLSLCRIFGSWCTCGLFEPSECLWWVRCLILNTISPLLLSCWGFSFALAHGVSFFLVGSNIHHQWFSNEVQFWSSQGRRCAYVLLLHHFPFLQHLKLYLELSRHGIMLFK